MAISNLTYKDYLWIKKENSNIYGIRLSKNNLPTDTVYIGDIPAVNNGTLTIQKNGTEIAKFTANSSTNQIANITVPTKVSELDNDSGFTSNKGTITEIKVNGTSKGISGSVNLTNMVTFASSQTANVAGVNKTTYRYNQPTGDNNTGNSNGSAYFPEGIIMGGTAASAGLVTRGICGVTTPDATTGACSKENLYINYDGSNTYQSNRQLVLQAGSAGTHYGHNLYEFAAARGDVVKEYCDHTYAAKSHPHNYAASDTAGGPANSVKNKLKFGSQTYDGSAEKTITLTDLGAATVATSGSYNDLSDKPTLPLATSDTLGGIKIGYSSTSNNLAVQLDNEKAYISLPDHLKKFYTTVVNKPVSSGFYAFQDTTNSSAKVAFGNKATAYTWVSANNSGWAGQIGISFHSDDIAFRRKENTTDNWKSWIGIATKPWVDQNYSLKGHTHKASEVSGLITTRDIFCVDLLKDRLTNEINLEGGQTNIDGNLLTMIYGTLAEEGVVGISLGLNNGTSELWFALVNDITDEVIYQSDNSIYDDGDTWFKDLNNLSNCHIEVFSCTYAEASNAFGKSDKGYSDYYDITLARENLTYLCTIRLNEDKTAWIVEQ